MRLIPRISDINISFVLYLDTQKQKKYYSPLVPIRKIINKNAYLHLNMGCSIPITNEIIVYYHKAIRIKARIEDVIDFLKKKKSRALIKTFFD